MKSAIRRPPAYQEYGSDMLGLERVKLMALGERGLLWSMRCHCWANDSIPASPPQMARVLGLDEEAVKATLSPGVLSFFAPLPGDQSRLYCPELAAQLSANMARREVLSESGGKGGRTTQRRRRAEEDPSERPAKPPLKPGLKPPEKRRDRDRDETELGKGADERKPSTSLSNDKFVRDMEEAERRESGIAGVGKREAPTRGRVVSTAQREDLHADAPLSISSVAPTVGDLAGRRDDLIRAGKALIVEHGYGERAPAPFFGQMRRIAGGSDGHLLVAIAEYLDRRPMNGDGKPFDAKEWIYLRVRELIGRPVVMDGRPLRLP